MTAVYHAVPVKRAGVALDVNTLTALEILTAILMSA